MLAACATWSCTRSGFAGSGDAQRVDARGGDVAVLDHAAPPLDGRLTDRPRDGRLTDGAIARDRPRDLSPLSKDQANPDKPRLDLSPLKDQAQKKDLQPQPDKKKASDLGPDPSGTYDIAPSITYSCALGVVSLNITAASFVDNSAKLTVTVTPKGAGGGCNVLTGDSAFDGSFTVTCVYAGVCTETYTLSGTFSGGKWTGAFTATYVGSCMNCTNQSWVVTGTRVP
jgi:hypothetical protein